MIAVISASVLSFFTLSYLASMAARLRESKNILEFNKVLVKDLSWEGLDRVFVRWRPLAPLSDQHQCADHWPGLQPDGAAAGRPGPLLHNTISGVIILYIWHGQVLYFLPYYIAAILLIVWVLASTTIELLLLNYLYHRNSSLKEKIYSQRWKGSI